MSEIVSKVKAELDSIVKELGQGPHGIHPGFSSAIAQRIQKAIGESPVIAFIDGGLEVHIAGEVVAVSFRKETPKPAAKQTETKPAENTKDPQAKG